MRTECQCEGVQRPKQALIPSAIASPPAQCAPALRTRQGVTAVRNDEITQN